MMQITQFITLRAAITLALILPIHVISYSEKTSDRLATLIVILSSKNTAQSNSSQNTKQTPPWSPTLKKRRLFELSPLFIPSYDSEKQTPPWSPTLESLDSKQTPPWGPLKPY